MSVLRRFFVEVCLYVMYTFWVVALGALLAAVGAESVRGFVAIGSSALVTAGAFGAAAWLIEDKRTERFLVSLLVAAVALPLSVYSLRDSLPIYVPDILLGYARTLVPASVLAFVPYLLHVVGRRYPALVFSCVFVVAFVAGLVAFAYFRPNAFASFTGWYISHRVLLDILVLIFFAFAFAGAACFVRRSPHCVGSRCLPHPCKRCRRWFSRGTGSASASADSDE